VRWFWQEVWHFGRLVLAACVILQVFSAMLVLADCSCCVVWPGSGFCCCSCISVPLVGLVMFVLLLGLLFLAVMPFSWFIRRFFIEFVGCEVLSF
jgi:hypothetical protein